MTDVSTAVVRVVVVGGSTGVADLVRAVEADGDLAVVGVCGDAVAVLDAVRDLRPHVVVIVGGRDGAATSTVEHIMAFAPTPVLVLRATTEDDGDHDELRAGAVEVLAWSHDVASSSLVRRRIRVLRRATVVRHPRGSLRPPKPAPEKTRRPLRPIVGMAASTGGPHTLVEVVRGLREITVPALIVQHIHPEFVDEFGDWLGRSTGANVTMARQGAVAAPGVFHVAPAGRHLTVTVDGRLELAEEPERLHRPSANELFWSMAAALGPSAIGVLLTGMGDDGAAGLLAIHRAGGTTIVQDAASSAIDGMPRAARERGAASVVAPLHGIASAVLAATGARR